jgi:cryptochrome
LEAIDNADGLYPVFVIDPHFMNPEKIGVNRIQFLLESLQDLDDSLKARNSKLIILRGKPESILVEKMKEWNVSKLCFESDTEPYAVQRDASMMQAAKGLNIRVETPVSHTLYDPKVLIAKNGGKAPLTMKSFETLVRSIGDPPKPAADPPSTLPPPSSCLGNLEAYNVPTLQELGYDHLSGEIKNVDGGETAGLARMAKYLSDHTWVSTFEKPKGNPTEATPYPATTMLSAYLKFGCVSPRLFYYKLQEVYRAKNGHHTKPPVSLLGQLYWREFFYCASVFVENFGSMSGNPICKQIDWETKQEFVNAWEYSKTGFPWIDAIMSQLRQEGWMHHLARHSVACFLTRGDLYCSWEDGRDIFDKYLLDADWAINSGNWMWLSASAFFSQYFRVYSPISFGKQYDKNGDYIRKYLPVLKDMPAKYIYEPWTAPTDVQKKASCIIGTDYPLPIVDHAVIHKENMQKMKRAYDLNKAANPGVKRSGASLQGKKAKK